MRDYTFVGTSGATLRENYWQSENLTLENPIKIFNLVSCRQANASNAFITSKNAVWMIMMLYQVGLQIRAVWYVCRQLHSLW